MRLAVVAFLACAGCDVLFQLEHVAPPGDGAVGSDGSADAAIGGTPNLVFVTSQQVVPGSLGGVEAADALCSSLAGTAGHPGHYVAWLSSSTSGVTSRIGTAARGWVRIDGKPFADTLVDIIQGHVWYPLRITESGDDVTSSGLDSDLVVVTGTNPDGSPGFDTCSDYTDPSRGATAGLADDAPYGWESMMGALCSAPARLYCFGIDHSAPVTLVPESARHAFVLVNDVTSGGSLASFDQVCNQEAAGGSLPGTYRAALATTSGSALSRFTTGMPWIRGDGVTAIDSTGKILAPLDLDAGGGIEGSTIAWSGAPTLSALAPNAAASCGDWTLMDTTLGLTGNVSRSGRYAFGGIPNGCNVSARVYCLQQ